MRPWSECEVTGVASGDGGTPLVVFCAPRHPWYHMLAGRGGRGADCPMPDTIIDFPPYRLDAGASQLWRGPDPVPLRPKAWALLCYLAARPGVLVMKEELHAALWADAVVSDDTL